MDKQSGDNPLQVRTLRFLARIAAGGRAALGHIGLCFLPRRRVPPLDIRRGERYHEGMPAPIRGVLVCDAYWRKTLSAIRALGRAGERVVAAERTSGAPGFFSRYTRARVVTPSPIGDPDAFVGAVADAAVRHFCDVILSGEEDSCGALLAQRDRLPARVRLVLGPARGFFALADKARLPALAAEADVPAPRTWRPESLAETQDLVRRTLRDFPAQAGWRIKPRRGSGGRGQRRVAHVDEVPEAWAAVHAQSPRPILQEEIPPGGPTIGVSVLLDDAGVRLAGFAHRRLREFPIGGGPSTLRESVSAPHLIDSTARLCRAAGWSGLAMAEFKQDPHDGHWLLVEVNPRLWGGIEGAIASGVNFPLLAVRWARGERVRPVNEYRLGVRTRWLIPGDLLHGVARLRRGEWPSELFRPSGSRVLDELLDPSDPRPLFALWPALAALWRVPEWRRTMVTGSPAPEVPSPPSAPREPRRPNMEPQAIC